MPIKTSSAKAKGRKLQQYVVKKLLNILQLEEGDAESRSMGSGGVDIMLSPKARRLFPFSMECKKTKKMPSLAEMKQAEHNAYKGTLPAVVWQPHGTSRTMITFDFDKFVEFWEEDGYSDVKSIVHNAMQGYLEKRKEQNE